MLLRLPDHDTCWKLFIFFGVRLALSTRGGKLGCSEFQFQIVTTAPSGLQRIPIVLRSQGLYMQSFAEKSCKINARHRTLTPLILVRIQVPQPLEIVYEIAFY
jgi:hypothetical protein